MKQESGGIKLLFIVFGVIGLGVGWGIVFLTKKLRKTKKSKLIVLLPSTISLVISIYLMYVGNVVVKGIDGAAYMMFSIIIFCFGATVFYMTDRTWKN
ncbi:hypothetical protein [Virgibacillus sp. DJP39]|uniref:hypothetical protein n=1 Tax=Virgibacillus sp. DJP39 TaxID=3409790 RepID=UPI003BB5A374